MLKENSKIVFNWVKDHDGENFTAADIAEATGLNVRSVNGIITRAFALHKDAASGEIIPLMERIPAEMELTDGTHKPIKLITLTEAGRAFDPDLDDKADADE